MTTERPWLASYPDGVPADYSFPQVPFTRLLDDAAAAFPVRPALRYEGRVVTYRELLATVDRVAGSLRELGVERGDRVAVVLPNCPQHVIALFAVARLGAITVHCNPQGTASELAAQLLDTQPKVVIVLDRALDTIHAAEPERDAASVVVCSLPDYYPRTAALRLRMPLPKARARRNRLTAEVPRGHRDFVSLSRRGQPARQVEVDPATDVALLQFTGGTTGTPKPAMLSHANLVANAYQTRLWLPDATTGRETTLGVLPLFHVFGLTLCLLTTVLLAGELVLLPRFDLDLVFAAIDRDRPTLFPGVPPIYRAILDSPTLRRHDLKSLHACISGAMKLPVAVQERFERVTGAALVEGYGTTETSPATHANPLNGKRKRGTVGLPLPGTDARIVALDDPARLLDIGEAGELAVRGPQVFRGYWNCPDETSVDADGWLLTGDIATMDADGYFTIVDRKKDLIIAGGFNIYPAELESVLSDLDGVADCCVVGLPDRYRGETVKAFVVRRDGAALTEQDVLDHCAHHLSAYKVPKSVEFRSALPHNAVGKALRRALVAEEMERRESS
ncbi:MAG TPA: long-chain fatty acid--CoA ligase [Mycobacteriales bacterium]|nr:long-chain fatty acid--CoA ligase [Mycobacteriales bacterium]